MRSLDILWGWDGANQQWLSYIPSRQTNSLTSVESGKGYWIHLSGPDLLLIQGNPGSSVISLAAGWNLIGYNGTDAAASAASLGNISGKWTTVWGWEAGGWSAKHESLSLPGTIVPLEKFYRQKAYWVRIRPNMATTWSQ
jgi:hypothetical protein